MWGRSLVQINELAFVTTYIELAHSQFNFKATHLPALLYSLFVSDENPSSSKYGAENCIKTTKVSVVI